MTAKDRSEMDPGFATEVEPLTKEQARAQPPGYGTEYVVVTEANLEHLRNGGVLYWSDSEYNHCMELVADRIGEILRKHYAPVAGVQDWRTISTRDETRLLAIYDHAVEHVGATSAINLYRSWLTIFAARVQPGERNIEDFERVVNSV